MSTATDHDLLSAWATRRDERAFAALVERYADLVATTCRRAGAAGADVDDAAQETFAALARDAGAVRGRVGAWLHVVARRQAGRALARRVPTLEAIEATAAQPRPDLDDALALLPAEEREVVRRAYLRDHTQLRIAADLRISQPTVHRRLGSGLARLRRLLAPAVAVAPAGAMRPAGIARAVAATIAVGAAATIAVAGSAAPKPDEGWDLVHVARAMSASTAWFAAYGGAAAAVEIGAWRRTLACGPWIGIALAAALALKYQERLFLIASLWTVPELMPGGWQWNLAVGVGTLALVAYALEIARSRARTGGWALARWAVAAMALAALIDAAAQARGFVGLPTRAEVERRWDAEQAARDAEATARDGDIRERRVIDGHRVSIVRRPEDPSPTDDELRARFREKWAR